MSLLSKIDFVLYLIIGRFTAHDIAVFARESSTSNVCALTPDDFPTVMHDSKNYFIDFFAPWCPPCMKLLPEWRKAGRQIGDTIAKFGTVDCTAHRKLCQDVSYVSCFQCFSRFITGIFSS